MSSPMCQKMQWWSVLASPPQMGMLAAEIRLMFAVKDDLT